MFGNGSLKRQIRELEADNDRLRRRVEERQQIINAYEQNLISERAENRRLQGRIEELEKLQLQVREQNEADLLFTSLKIAFEVLNGKKKEELKTDVDYQRQLHDARMAQYHAVTGSGLSGLLGNMFGN